MKKVNLIIILLLCSTLFGCSIFSQGTTTSMTSTSTTTELDLQFPFVYYLDDYENIDYQEIIILLEIDSIFDTLIKYVDFDESDMPAFYIGNGTEYDNTVINIDNPDVIQYDLIYRIISSIFNYGLSDIITALSYSVLFDLQGISMDFSNDDIIESLAILLDEGLDVCFELQGFCFEEDDYYSTEIVEAVKIYSYELLSFIVDMGDKINSILDARTEKSSYIYLFNIYLEEFFRHNEIQHIYQIQYYIRFYSGPDPDYFYVESEHALWMVNKEYKDYMEGLIFDYGFLYDSPLAIYSMILIEEREFCNIDTSTQSIKPETILHINLRKYSDVPYAYYSGGTIMIGGIIHSLSHEYVHFLSSQAGVSVSWIHELRSSYFSFSDPLQRDASDYFLNQCIDNIDSTEYCVVLNNAYYQFVNIYGREFLSNQDYLDFNDLYVYLNGDFDGVYINSTETSNAQRVSFARYFIDTYGIAEFNLFCINYSGGEVIDGKTMIDLISDWEIYILDKWNA